MADGLLAFGKLSDAEREQLRAAVNLLFTESFLVRSIDHHAAPYRFVVSNYELVEDYLGLAGWGLRRDEALGVVAFQGPASARLTLTKDETVMLLILRLLFEEKAGEIALHGERTVRQQDIQEKYRVLAEATWKKTRYLTMLRRFQALRLIRIVGEESDPQATIVLYPSIPFALDGIAVEEAVARIGESAGADKETEDTEVGGDEEESD